MNVAQIRADLADALGTVCVSVAEHRTDRIDGFPAAIIDVDTITPDTFGDGSYNVDCTIRVLVSKADSPDAWSRLDELLSDNTISDALRDSDVVQTVGAYDNIGADIDYDDGVALGFTISVVVLA